MDIIVDELKYNDKNIIVLKDSNNMVWFNAIDVCKILGYKNNRDVIMFLVNKSHRKYLKDIFPAFAGKHHIIIIYKQIIIII